MGRKNKRIFIDIDDEQNELLPLITEKFPEFIDYSRRWHADPLIVAIAMGKNWKVVSGESFSKSGKPHIPDVCKHFSVDCKNLFEFIEDNNWEFAIREKVRRDI